MCSDRCGGGDGGGRDADISMVFSPRLCLFSRDSQSIYHTGLLRERRNTGGCILVSDIIRICGVG